MLPEIHTAIPGPRSKEAAELLRHYESPNVTYLDAEFPVFWERAEGTNVWDADGNRYLDWTSAFGVTGLGHSAPVFRDALVAQVGRLIHGMGDVHPTPLKARLCQRLSELTFERWGAGPGKTILGNSGFEAVEAALKTALLSSGKPGVIAFHGAYHGLGYGALEVAGTPYFREPFRSQLKDFATLLPYPHGPSTADGDDFPEAAPGWKEQLEAQIAAAVAARPIGAILVEPIQGRGGEIVPPRGFLPLLRHACDRHGLLLIADEIYTGLNRTGALFACEHSGVIPDIICTAKALTGGFPLSACVGREAVMNAWPVSQGEALHTSTFLGNPLGCAMALASLDAHADPALARHVAERGARLKAALRTLRSPLIKDVRGVGLLAAMEFALDGAALNAVVKRALRDGLILLQSGPAGDVLAFTPPFIISDEEIDFTIGRLLGYLQT